MRPNCRPGRCCPQCVSQHPPSHLPCLEQTMSAPSSWGTPSAQHQIPRPSEVRLRVITSQEPETIVSHIHPKTKPQASPPPQPILDLSLPTVTHRRACLASASARGSGAGIAGPSWVCPPPSRLCLTVTVEAFTLRTRQHMSLSRAPCTPTDTGPVLHGSRHPLFLPSTS